MRLLWHVGVRDKLWTSKDGGIKDKFRFYLFLGGHVPHVLENSREEIEKNLCCPRVPVLVLEIGLK